MKVLQINSVCGIRSTGRICTDLAEVLEGQGHSCKIGYGRETVPERHQKYAVRIGNELSVKLDALQTRIFDDAGFHSKSATKRFLSWVREYDPDIIHLHNIHGYYLNIQLLFDFLKQFNKPVVWTLHDCWAFTGHCSHFAAQGCQRWQEQCFRCPLRSAYPASIFVDNSRKNFTQKKKLFTGPSNMQLVTPSRWLAQCVEQSFLGSYPVRSICNGIDLTAFQPTESDFAATHHLQNKKIVLGVASAWSEHKGLQKFYRLADLLDDSYQVVLVGLDHKQINTLPKNILGIPRTGSVRELAQIYTAAYVHVVMSQEETMGMTVVEANACGTPVIVFDRTALPEIVTPETGLVLAECTPEAVCAALTDTDFSKDCYKAACISHGQKFEKEKMYERYIELYRSMVT